MLLKCFLSVLIIWATIGSCTMMSLSHWVHVYTYPMYVCTTLLRDFITEAATEEATVLGLHATTVTPTEIWKCYSKTYCSQWWGAVCTCTPAVSSRPGPSPSQWRRTPHEPHTEPTSLSPHCWPRYQSHPHLSVDNGCLGWVWGLVSGGG